MVTVTARGLWTIHGVCMGMSWGIFAPLAIGSVFLRNRFNFLKSNAWWFRVHLCLAILVAVFTGVGAAVAIVAEIRDEDGVFEESLRFDDDVHEFWGYFITAVVFLQAVVAYARPAKVVVTPKYPPTGEDTDNHDHNDEGIFRDEEKQHGEEGEGVADNNDEGATTMMAKSKICTIRKLWEYTHRLFGILLLCLAWFNCHSGIFLFAEHYGPVDNLVKFFWGMTGSLTTIIVILRIFWK